MKKIPELSIIIPAYNEEKRICKTLKKYNKYFKSKDYDYEIIVVIDKSKDRTEQLVVDFAKKNKNIIPLIFEQRRGKGGAIIEGFKIARADKVGFSDADEAVSSEYIEKMFDCLSKYDCVIASRRLKQSKISRHQPIIRQVLSKGFNILVNIMFGLNIKDTQCGAKVFRSKVIKESIQNMKSKGFEFDVELLWRIKKNNYSIKEYPIEWSHQDDSSFSLKEVPSMFINLLKLKVN
ncbi:MAG: glycosyltransferase family 2 protein [Candidatus Aenigmarchaeota archaeon]|nr:glycosyltransferase family 2 protein [Candidatus Aenigmarchaeota archaeon]